MNSYRYRITVEMLTGAKGEAVEGRSLTFEAANHDDILEIVERMRSRLPFDENTTASLGVGLKLFSEVALVHRADPMFASIRPALSEFIGRLKKRPGELAELPTS
ncbi:uncharacterized protein DUF3861 [Edaphobacter aggregans]|uniref:Uncharacterized protein DUF3861 n=1 Tax=Edaphobacter aggregans TaxID=570835 RepID=A0A3R9WFH2_9BACT|nr:DUF3861 domain-containing protein [Edaphobacter aggregans]RSL15912.1 uncharacterized protein DUF3861 [Edaphobacter aggregans]